MIDKKFFPSFAQLSSVLRVKSDVLQTKRKVAISGEVLKEIIMRALADVDFDQDWYLATYPDIRAAWTKGEIGDLKEHFISTGYFEGRLPCEGQVDEQWYLKKYPDVRGAISTGRVKSAAEHFWTKGQFEWRVPNSVAEAAVVNWIRLISP